MIASVPEVMLDGRAQHTARPAGAWGPKNAIDVNDFVFAATGAHVRRLTLPDGTHWFPAVDVAVRLGYANTRQALIWHVPESCKTTLGDLVGSVYKRDTSRKIAGHGLKKSMRMVNLHGLVGLVNACTKPEAEPFKNWVCEVVVAVQQDGSYALTPAEVQAPDPDAPTVYSMPSQVADAIVRLEELNLRLDRQYADARREDLWLRREMLHKQQDMAHSLSRIAEALERFAGRDVLPAPGPQPLSAQDRAATMRRWRQRLTVTQDVWPVAEELLSALTESGSGRVSRSREQLAAATGMTAERVLDCVRMMVKHRCIRQVGLDERSVPVYELDPTLLR